MKRKRNILWYILVAILVLYFAVSLFTQQMKINESKEKMAELEEKINAVQEESEQLKKEIENAECKETVEAIAREKLGLLYPDERKFVDSNG